MFISKIFNKLTAYHHFLVFLIILSILKIVNVFIYSGAEAGLHFMKLGAALFVISSLLYLGFKYTINRQKKYLHVLISTFLILLVLSHEDPDPIRGLLVIVLLFVSKFVVKYKNQTIFNPIVFAIGITTLLAFITPLIGIPPLDWSGIDIQFVILNTPIPISLLPIILALIFNVGRIRKHPLALSFIATMLIVGFLASTHGNNFLSYTISTFFIGAAIIVEPKTSPKKPNEQIVYGVLMALMIIGFSLLEIPNAPVMALLLGNILYFVYKRNILKADN